MNFPSLEDISPEARALLELASKYWLSIECYKEALHRLNGSIIRMRRIWRVLQGVPTDHLLDLSQLRDAAQHLDDSLEDLDDICNDYKLHDMQSLLDIELSDTFVVYATGAAERGEFIDRVASAPVYTFEIPQKKDFPLFTCLPMEIQIMIWKAAASPPPCQHYSFSRQAPGPLGLHGYRGDRGLWGACKVSREIISEVYLRQRDSHCTNFHDKLELTYQNRVRFVNDCNIRQMQVSVFNLQLKDFLKTCFAAGSLLAELQKVIVAFYDIEQDLDGISLENIDALVPSRGMNIRHLSICPGL